MASQGLAGAPQICVDEIGPASKSIGRKIKGVNTRARWKWEFRISISGSTLQTCLHRHCFHLIKAASDFGLCLLARCHSRPSVSLCAQEGGAPSSSLSGCFSWPKAARRLTGT